MCGFFVNSGVVRELLCVWVECEMYFHVFTYKHLNSPVFPRIVGVTDGVIAVWEKDFFSNISLTHYSPVLLFYIPWKHQKTFRWMLPSCRNQLREQKRINLLNVIQDMSYVVLRKCQYRPGETPYLDTFQAV